jgi:hypothetical protein
MFGDVFYEKFFSNFVTNLSPLGSRIGALHHRKMWLPLYFPETIKSCLTSPSGIESHKNEISPLNFLVPKNKSLAQHFWDLNENLKLDKNFVLIKTNKISLIQKLNQSDRNDVFFISIDELIDYLINNNLLKDEALFLRNSISTICDSGIDLFHFCILNNPNKTVFFANPENGLFRYSVSPALGDNNISHIVFEFSKGSSIKLDEVSSILVALGYTPICGGTKISAPFKPKVLNVDSGTWSEIRTKIQNHFDNFSTNIHIIHPESLSFNDSLIRGIAVGLSSSKGY